MGVSAPRRRAGFSMIEVLVSAAIFLIIVLGVVPFFTLAQRSNRTGAESTELANHARSRIEEFFQMPFGAPDLTLDSGTSEKVHDEYYSSTTHTWKDGAAPVADPALWQRTTRVRQFSINALNDGVLAVAEALPDTAPAETVHIKEIQVLVESVRDSSIFGPPQRLTLTTIKSQ